MIHRIYSDLETFKNLELHGGLNVLLTDRHEKATEGQTRAIELENQAWFRSFILL